MDMARPLRVEYSGAWYHVMNRGMGHQSVFHDSEYFYLFLDLLLEAHKRYQIQIHAYCLMDNHYHLLIHTPLPNLGKAMQYIDGLYTVRHNRLFGRDGPLFRGRYKAILVEADNYLLQLSRYIHLNPVSAEIVKDPEEYIWSSYRYFVRLSEKPVWLYLDETLRFFSNNRSENYREFVLQDTKNEVSSFYSKPRTLPILGSTDFVGKIKRLSSTVSKAEEIPEHYALVRKYLPTVEEVINATAICFSVAPSSIVNNENRIRDNLPRKLAIYLSCYLTGKNQKEIATIFNDITYSAISKTCSRFEQVLKENDEILSKADSIKESLSKKSLAC